MTSSTSEVSRFPRDEPRADPLNLVRPGLAAGDHRRIDRFDRDRLEIRVLCLEECATTPVIVPPVPTPATMASMSWPLSSQISGPVVVLVDRRIGGILELLRHPGVRVRFDQFMRPPDGPFHPFGGRRQHQFGTQGPQQGPTFERHRFRHRQGQPVALRRTDEGQGDARIAAGRLDDVRFGVDLSVLSRRLRSSPRRCGP